MEDDSWSGSYSTSKRYQSNEFYLSFDEIDSDDEPQPDFPCPFCEEDFDIIGLCCHIDDEHPVEAKNGICPVCGVRVGMDMVAHISMQHGQFIKMQRRKRFQKGGSHSSIALLKKELLEGNLQYHGGYPEEVSSSNSDPDPLLSSLIYNMPVIDEPTNIEPLSTAERDPSLESSDEEVVLERSAQAPPLSDKEQEEKACRSDFVQSLLLSTMFDDIL